MRLVLLLALTGCAYSSAFKGSERVADALCQRAFACQSSYPDDAELAFDELYGTSVPRCIAEIGPGDPEPWEAAVDAEQLTYDRDVAKACVEALEVVTCEALFAEPAPEACDGVFAGTRDEGASCAIDEVCVSGWCRNGACAP